MPGHDHQLDQWVSVLPFPLASLLWDHLAKQAIEPTDSLFDFLEVGARWSAIVTLSGLAADRDLYEQARPSWQGRDRPSRQVAMATLGTWVTLHSGLSKALRRAIQTEPQRVETAFGLNDVGPVKLLSSRELGAVLGEVQKYRNEWRGHASIASWNERLRRLNVLEAVAARFCEIVGRAFDGWELVAPKEARFREGAFEHRVDVLVGPIPTFRQRRVSVTNAMEADEPHLVSHERKRGLQLIPLIRLVTWEGTSNAGIYFYDRMDRRGVRWLSYHFEAAPEIVEPASEELLRVIADLDTPEISEPDAPPSVRADTPRPAAAPRRHRLVASSTSSGHPIDVVREASVAMGMAVRAPGGEMLISVDDHAVGWMRELGGHALLTVEVPIEKAPYLPGRTIVEIPVAYGGRPAIQIRVGTDADVAGAVVTLATAMGLTYGWQFPSESIRSTLDRAATITPLVAPPIAWGVGWKAPAVLGDEGWRRFWTPIIEAWDPVLGPQPTCLSSSRARKA